MGTFKKIAEIFRKIVIGYIFYTLPLNLIGIIIIASYAIPVSPKSTEEIFKFLNDVILKNPLCTISAAQFAIWIPTSLLFSITMFFSRNTREIVLKRLSGIKERDEREVQIVGKALRASYLSTMTILLFLLFISFIKVESGIKSVDNIRPSQHPNMKYFYTGLGFEIIDSEAIITQKEGYTKFFQYCDIPLSTSTLILILLVWQIISFRVVSQRVSKVPD